MNTLKQIILPLVKGAHADATIYVSNDTIIIDINMGDHGVQTIELPLNTVIKGA